MSQCTDCNPVLWPQSGITVYVIDLNDPQAMKGRGDGHEGELESVRIVLKRDAI